VSGGSETDHQKPGSNVTEAGYRPSPIALVSESTRLELGNALSMLDQPRTKTAGNHLSFQVDETSLPHACAHPMS
jgi:hypothetical protein